MVKTVSDHSLVVLQFRKNKIALLRGVKPVKTKPSMQYLHLHV